MVLFLIWFSSKLLVLNCIQWIKQAEAKFLFTGGTWGRFLILRSRNTHVELPWGYIYALTRQFWNAHLSKRIDLIIKKEVLGMQIFSKTLLRCSCMPIISAVFPPLRTLYWLILCLAVSAITNVQTHALGCVTTTGIPFNVWFTVSFC